MKSTLKLLFLVSITILLASCKLAVVVVEGGEVQSTGSGTCVASMVCIVDVSNPNFSETFAAIPENGWYFQRWNKGDRFFCAGSNKPVCTLSFEGYEETVEVDEMVASSEMFYLMPIFKRFQDTVRVEGKEWLQPDLFVNLSWKQINAVCPAGVCAGSLNGYDLTGWTWASLDDFNELMNYYLGTAVDVEPDPISANSEWAYAFLADGWRDDPDGWLRNFYGDTAATGRISAFFAYDDINTAIGSISTGDDEIFHKFINRGGWFFRTN